MSMTHTNADTAGVPLPDPLTDSPQPPQTAYWRTLADAPFTETVFINSVGSPLAAGIDLSHVTVVLPQGGEAEARDWLGSGAARVLFADAAISDTGFIRRMVAALGADKVGVWLPVKRMGVKWVLDKTSNADFSCMTPSVGKPAWEVLHSNHARTGIDADWWARQMRQQGASCILVSTDYSDAHDHNIAAEMVEKCAGTLWFSPLGQTTVEWEQESWQRYGNASQFVLPPEAEAETEVV